MSIQKDSIKKDYHDIIPSSWDWLEWAGTNIENCLLTEVAA
jgi:hypothetical protein